MFADQDVIAFVNSHMVAVELVVTDQGWPTPEHDFPELTRLASVFSTFHHCRFGFSVNVVVSPGVPHLLATATGGESQGLEFAVEYDPPAFLQLLEEALDLHQRLTALPQDADERRLIAVDCISRNFSAPSSY